MKNILFILLFFTCTAQAQIAITSSDNDQAEMAFSNILSSNPDYVAGRLYVFVLTTTKAASTPDVPTMSGTGQTWTQINTITTATSRTTAFRFYCTSSTTSSTNVSCGADQTSYVLNKFEITGTVSTGTNGADAIVQSATNTGSGVDPSITLSAISSSSNAVISVFTNNTNPFNGSVEAGWTESYDSGNTLPKGGYAMYRTTTTDNTPTVTAASSDWAGIAIEIKSLARRRIIID